ncbi:MAG: AIPR family protein [Geminicoccaceae bacterium]
MAGGDYAAYLIAVPARALAEIYIQHGSRLLEGNVRTFLGRRGNVNKGIASMLAKEPQRFFAYNNGIAATATAVINGLGPDGVPIITSATDLQIVNGAQTTASLAKPYRSQPNLLDGIFEPMKLSVVAPELAEKMIPRISRFANSQSAVRASDFFANHAFHRKVQELSRRLLAPAVGDSQVQTHWYYERARGQYLNEQATLTSAKKQQFLRLNPRNQLITKTDLAKAETCFALLPDIACKGAEKSFVDFAERVTKEWADEDKRALYGDDWFRAAVARIILFRAAERLVSEASWYEGGYRAQIVAYTLARLAQLVQERSRRGSLDHARIWSAQAAGDVLERQMLVIGEVMAGVLRNPPQAGQNISEWAKQQACRKRALETDVPILRVFDGLLLDKDDVRSERKDSRADGRVDLALECVAEVMDRGSQHWQRVRDHARVHRLLFPGDEKALLPALNLPKMVPSDRQAEALIALHQRCEKTGFKP